MKSSASKETPILTVNGDCSPSGTKQTWEYLANGYLFLKG